MPMLPLAHVRTPAVIGKCEHKDSVALTAFRGSTLGAASLPIHNCAVLRSLPKDFEIYVIVLLPLG